MRRAVYTGADSASVRRRGNLQRGHRKYDKSKRAEGASIFWTPGLEIFLICLRDNILICMIETVEKECLTVTMKGTLHTEKGAAAPTPP